MIPSVYQAVEEYRKTGRINQQAALEVILGDKFDICWATRKPATGNCQLIIDACMFADLHISDMVRHGVTEPELEACVENSLQYANEWRVSQGMPAIELQSVDAITIRRYIVKSVKQGYESYKLGSMAWTVKVKRLCGELGIPENTALVLAEEIPYKYAARFITSTTDRELKQYLEDEYHRWEV